MDRVAENPAATAENFPASHRRRASWRFWVRHQAQLDLISWRRSVSWALLSHAISSSMSSRRTTPRSGHLCSRYGSPRSSRSSRSFATCAQDGGSSSPWCLPCSGWRPPFITPRFFEDQSRRLVFGAVFLLESGLLVWYGVVRDQLHWTPGRSARHLPAWVVIAYGLLYPLIVLAEGHVFPRMPTFGVPCPTTILTIGFLLAADSPIPYLVAVIPIAWSALGGLAPFQLGVRADLGLLASGVILVAYVLAPVRRRIGLRA
jgi:hypothetical protein